MASAHTPAAGPPPTSKTRPTSSGSGPGLAGPDHSRGLRSASTAIECVEHTGRGMLNSCVNHVEPQCVDHTYQAACGTCWSTRQRLEPADRALPSHASHPSIVWQAGWACDAHTFSLWCVVVVSKDWREGERLGTFSAEGG
eukprot:366129-Chlamydomonas_euryale.AAC.5